MALVIRFVVQTTFLVIGLGTMIRIQKLDWSFFGLVGPAVLASGLALIPYAGHFLAVPVLFVFIARTTHGDPFPNVAFTVAIAYALMFGANHFLLHHFIRGLPIPILAGSTPEPATNSVATNIVDALPEPVEPTNPPGVISFSGKRPSTASRTANTAPVDPNKPPPTLKEIARTFSVKSVINNSNSSLATVHSGVRTYTVGVNETVTMDTIGGRLPVKCLSIGETSVIMNVGGERIQLFLR